MDSYTFLPNRSMYSSQWKLLSVDFTRLVDKINSRINYFVGSTQTEKDLLKINQETRKQLRLAQYMIEDLCRWTRKTTPPTPDEVREEGLKVWDEIKAQAGNLELTCRYPTKVVYKYLKTSPKEDAVPEDRKKVSSDLFFRFLVNKLFVTLTNSKFFLSWHS